MSGDSSSGDGFAGFLKRHKEWAGAITAVVGAIFGLPRIFDAAKGNVTWSVLSGAGLGWLFLFWVYTRKTEREVWGGIDQQPKLEKVSPYPRGRKWSLVGLIAIPVLTISGFALVRYVERPHSNKTIVLIADFQGPDQRFAVTQTVINRMKRATHDFPEVRIQPFGEVIKEGVERDEIHAIGDKYQASIVVWGFYTEALNGTIHIDYVRRTNCHCLRRNEMDFNVEIAEGRGISVQEAISGDMNLLALLLIGIVRYDAEDYDGAIVRFTKALGQLYSSSSKEEVADVKFLLGKSLCRKGNYGEAVDKFQAVASVREDDTSALNWLGLSLLKAGRYADAAPVLKRALALNEKMLGPEHPDTATQLNNLAMLYYEQGQYEEAKAVLERVLAIREKALGPEHPDTANSLNNLGALYQAQGQYGEAEQLYKRALAINEKALGKEHPSTATNLSNLAEIYRTLGKYEEAEPRLKQALAIREKALGPEHPDTANSLNNLAGLYKWQGKYQEAEPLYQRAIGICEKVLGKDHPVIAEISAHYADLLHKMNRSEEAATLEARAAEIRAKTSQKKQD